MLRIKFLSLLFSFLFFIPISIFSQGGEAAVPFLTMQQSPLLIGAGQIGTAIPNKDALGFYLNPAQLGYSSLSNNLSTCFTPQETDWMPNYHLGRNSSYGFSAGYNFNQKYNIPLSIGIGYIHNKFSSGNFSRSNATFRAYDKFDSYSFGIGYQYYLLFNIGFSAKTFQSHSEEAFTIDGEKTSFNVNGTASDFGIMVIAPISDLFFDNYKYDLNGNTFLKPKFNFTLGYSVNNIGKEVSFINDAQKDPIPRTARMGYTFDFGIDLFSNDLMINTIDYSFTAEAEDLLIQKNSGFENSNQTRYESIASDIQPIKHLILLKGNDDIVVHKGHIVKIYETVVLTSGGYSGAGYNSLRTNGFALATDGLFKVLAAKIDNNIFHFMVSHFSFEYYNTNLFVGRDVETNLKGIAVYFRGIN